MHVEFVQTKGKKSEILKSVDKFAKEAREGGIQIDRGFQPYTVARSMIKGAATRFPAKGQIALIRPYRKKLMPTGEEKIRFDTLSEGGQVYVACYYAYATTEIAAQLHRQHRYRVRFNDAPNYPQIMECIEEVTPS